MFKTINIKTVLIVAAGLVLGFFVWNNLSQKTPQPSSAISDTQKAAPISQLPIPEGPKSGALGQYVSVPPAATLSADPIPAAISQQAQPAAVATTSPVISGSPAQSNTQQIALGDSRQVYLRLPPSSTQDQTQNSPRWIVNDVTLSEVEAGKVRQALAKREGREYPVWRDPK